MTEGPLHLQVVLQTSHVDGFEHQVIRLSRGGRVVVENGPDLCDVVWDIDALGLADAFQGAVLVQQFEAGLGANASDARMEIRADHDAQVNQLFLAQIEFCPHCIEINPFCINRPSIALRTVCHEVSHQHR